LGAVNCSQVRELAGAYVLDALARHERQRLEQHLDRCPRCRRQVAEWSEAVGAFAASALPAVPPPPAVKEQLLARARLAAAPASQAQAGLPVTSGQARPVRRPWRPQLAALGRVVGYGLVALALVVAGWGLARWVPPAPAPMAGRAGPDAAAALLEQELWRSLAPQPSLVVRLSVDRKRAARAAGAVAAVGAASECWLRLVAVGVPTQALPLTAWVVLEDGTERLVGPLRPAGEQRWEVQAKLPLPPERLHAVQLRSGQGDKVMWGPLWQASEGSW